MWRYRLQVRALEGAVEGNGGVIVRMYGVKMREVIAGAYVRISKEKGDMGVVDGV